MRKAETDWLTAIGFGCSFTHVETFLQTLGMGVTNYTGTKQVALHLLQGRCLGVGKQLLLVCMCGKALYDPSCLERGKRYPAEGTKSSEGDQHGISALC